MPLSKLRCTIAQALGSSPPADCECLCQHNHPGRMGVCRGQKSAVVHRLYHSTVVGDVWVPLCGPCVEAAMEQPDAAR